MLLQSLKQIGRMQRIVECSKYLLNDFLFISSETYETFFVNVVYDI